MRRRVTFKANPLTVAGRAVKEGSPAPNFHVVTGDLEERTLDSFADKIKVFTTFPSIDTPVCDLQVKEFNKKASSFSPDVVVVGISKDLPFAQKRFCETHNIDKVITLSDYKTGSFGINYGLLIQELNLLARSAIIVDKADNIRSIHIVEELTHAPDYEAVLKKLQEVIARPGLKGQGRPAPHCIPCEVGTPPLAETIVKERTAMLSGWELIDNKKIKKSFVFNDFVEAKYFVDMVSVIAEEQGHHPTITIVYNKVTITFTTHASGGLTDNDFIMAAIIEELS